MKWQNEGGCYFSPSGEGDIGGRRDKMAKGKRKQVTQSLESHPNIGFNDPTYALSLY